MQRPLRRRRILRAIEVAAVLVAVGACSSPPSPGPPTVNFESNGGTSVGMPGMSGMPQQQSVPGGPGSASAPSAAADGPAVTIGNFAFVPATLTVRRGDTVTWTNRDEEHHTVAANDGSFDSPGMDANGTYSFAFSTPGTFDYICSIHPFMHGTVVVTS